MLLRTVWDISYQFLFLYVLIAIITGAPLPAPRLQFATLTLPPLYMCSLGCRPTGIVIDAFGGLRDKKDAEEEDIKVMSQSAETYMIFCIASAHQNCSCIAALWPNAPLSPLQANCFVCNLDRFSLDQRGIGFDRHIVRPPIPGTLGAIALRCIIPSLGPFAA